MLWHHVCFDRLCTYAVNFKPIIKTKLRTDIVNAFVYLCNIQSEWEVNKKNEYFYQFAV